MYIQHKIIAARPLKKIKRTPLHNTLTKMAYVCVEEAASYKEGKWHLYIKKEAFSYKKISVCVCVYILRCHVNKQQMTVLNNRKNMMYSLSFVMTMSQIHLKNNLLTKCPHSMLSEADNMWSLKLKKWARIFNCTATSSPSCDDSRYRRNCKSNSNL